MQPTEPRFAFDGFLFDPVTGELSGPAGSSRLPPKPARLLALLLERPGELVAREELEAELWPGQHVELDQSLAYTVRQVRAALGDEAGEPRFVETLPRRGYRFVGHLDDGPRVAATPNGRESGRAWRGGVAVAALVLTAAAILTWAGRGERDAGRGQALGHDPVRVALLPLDDPGAGAVNDRLTEALLVALTGQPGLDVVGPATTRALRGADRPHTDVGRELGVEFVVSGGYRSAEEVLFVQMVRVSDGGHLFARRYPGSEQAVRDRLPEVATALAAAAVAER